MNALKLALFLPLAVNAATFEWTQPTDTRGIEGYRVYCQTGTDSPLIFDAPGLVDTVSDGDALVPAINYDCWARSYGGGGSLESADSNHIPVVVDLSAPGGLTVTLTVTATVTVP